jgi:hypothetical protein
MNMDMEISKKQKNLITEFAEETGIDITQYNKLNKGSLTSRQNGYVGGYIGGTMTKKLVEHKKTIIKGLAIYELQAPFSCFD